MANREVTTQNLVRQESIQFIRPQTLVLTLSNGRPNTNVFVFFGDENVTHMCGLRGQNPGTTLFTDANGSAEISFTIPEKRFNTGDHNIIVSEIDDLDVLDMPGSTYGAGRAVFRANGRLDVFQTTETTIVRVERPEPVNRDPLAQSFFTYGVNGGIFLSSIDLYFFTKDDSVPIRVEVRPLVNGMPAPLESNHTNFVSSLESQYVNVSTDASIKTNFRFDPPIYLKQDSEYCFVILTNSNKYQVFTSRMGEASVEDGSTIFEQPYLGSLFKSENNVTWTAEQLEDIKFTMHKAKFDTTKTGRIRYAVDAPYLGAAGTMFESTAGSNKIKYRHTQDHGLTLGSVIDVVSNSGYTVNGIDSVNLTGEFDVIEVPDSKTVVFEISENATVTGQLKTSNIIQHAEILSGGTNYSQSDTVQFVGGGATTAATGQLTVTDGVITGITLTSPGDGYTSEPQVVISTTTGTGAKIVATLLPSFSVLTNKPFEGFTLAIDNINYDGCELLINLYSTTGSFEGGNLSTYTSNGVTTINPNFLYGNMFRNMIVASTKNEVKFMSGNESAIIEIEFTSKNPNVSPVINTTTPMTFNAMHRRIGPQAGEDLNSENSSASLTDIIVTNQGSLYQSTPIVEIDPPSLDTGVQATAIAVLTGGAVTDITITEAGSGYTRVPIVRITPDTGDTVGSGATAQAQVTAFNSERLPVGGSAKAKYINRVTRLQIISNGVRLFSTISSVQGGSVDWYIRTSLSSSGVDHDKLEWTRIPCNIDRNRSEYIGDFREYEFRLDEMPDFDTYDLKCVLTATDPTQSPIVKSYRVIALA